MPELDERLLATPSIALERCRRTAADMALCAVGALKESLAILKKYSPELAAKIHAAEEKTDRYEDMLGTYLVKLSARRISESEISSVSPTMRLILRIPPWN